MMPTAPNPELLRTRIRLLANLLGKVIERQAGAETLQTIEYLRQGFIEERNNPDPERRAALMRTIARLRNLAVWRLPAADTQALATLAERSMQLQATVLDGVLTLSSDKGSVSLEPQLWQ